MKLLGIALLLVSSSAFASTHAYDLKLNLTIGGKPISSPRMIIKEGKPALFSQERGSEKQFIEVVATESVIQDRKGILMQFTIGTIGRNGERIIVANSRVLVRDGEPATITQSNSKSGESPISISVTATKTTL